MFRLKSQSMFSKWICTASVFMLQEMKALTKSFWGIGLYPVALSIWNQNQQLRLQISICISWEVIWWPKKGWRIFKFELDLWKIAKYWRNNIPSKVRQKIQKNEAGPKNIQFCRVKTWSQMGPGSPEPPGCGRGLRAEQPLYMFYNLVSTSEFSHNRQSWQHWHLSQMHQKYSRKEKKSFSPKILIKKYTRLFGGKWYLLYIIHLCKDFQKKWLLFHSLNILIHLN